MSPCDTCAFGVSGAALEPLNRLRAAICAASGRPFFCHHSRSGKEFDWRDGNAVNFYAQHPSERKVCEGWRHQVAQFAALGHFQLTDNQADRALLLRYQRMLGADALCTLDEFLAEDGPPKADARRRLESILEALHVHRSYDQIQLEVAA
jgi:hypothetical protein